MRYSRKSLFFVFSIVALASVLMVFKLSSQHTSRNTKAQTTKSASHDQLAGVNNYPPSRFQPGRPSKVVGLKIISVDPVAKTATFTWKANPAAEGVDKYALYYHSFYPVQGAARGTGALAAVVDTTTIKVNMVVKSRFDFSTPPYGLDEITICTISDQCYVSPFDVQQPYEVTAWVIAHNKNGWGDNDYQTPNPDENPDFFVQPSTKQSKFPGAFITYDAMLDNFDGSFATLPWPTQTPISSSQLKKWTVTWLPDVELPVTRYGPNRPQHVIGLKITKFDVNSQQLGLTWRANLPEDHVDKYAVYYSSSSDLDDVLETEAWYITTVSATNFKGKIVFETGPNDNVVDTSTTPPSIFFNPGTTYTFWVIAHNSNGWGDNNPNAANPDQTDDDYRYPSHEELGKLTQLTSTVDLVADCTYLAAKETGCK